MKNKNLVAFAVITSMVLIVGAVGFLSSYIKKDINSKNNEENA
jgi:hypothetical protein